MHDCKNNAQQHGADVAIKIQVLVNTSCVTLDNSDDDDDDNVSCVEEFIHKA